MSDQAVVKGGESVTQRGLITLIGEIDRVIGDGGRALREVETEIDKLIANRDKIADEQRVAGIRKKALRAAIRVLEDEGVI